MDKRISILTIMPVLLLQIGCTSMKYLSQDELSELKEKQTVCLTMINGDQHKIKYTKIIGSKITGYIQNLGYQEFELSLVKSIGIKQVDTKRVILYSVAGTAAAIILISNLQSDSDGGSYDDNCNT